MCWWNSPANPTGEVESSQTNYWIPRQLFYQQPCWEDPITAKNHGPKIRPSSRADDAENRADATGSFFNVTRLGLPTDIGMALPQAKLQPTEFGTSMWRAHQNACLFASTCEVFFVSLLGNPATRLGLERSWAESSSGGARCANCRPTKLSRAPGNWRKPAVRPLDREVVSASVTQGYFWKEYLEKLMRRTFAVVKVLRVPWNQMKWRRTVASAEERVVLSEVWTILLITMPFLVESYSEVFRSLLFFMIENR